MPIRFFCAALALLISVATASAADLTIAVGADVTSIDPHYHNLTPNNNIAEHIFETLVTKDPKSLLKPALAVSWKAIDDLTWEFKLRKGVKFHDGSDFTAADVVFSIERTAQVPNSPSPFTLYTNQITEKVIVDPLTLRLKTAAPYPLMPNDMGTVFIVSSKAAKGATTADFDSGKAAVGTGPFKFVRYAKGDRIELARNDGYWGTKTAWDKVTFRVIASDPSRVAALLSGDVRAIESVPTADLARLSKDPSIAISRTVSHRLIFLHLDTNRDKSPFVTDKSGKPLDKNPLKDLRVRKALSKAINRQAIVDRTMEGAAVATGQLMPEGMFGFVPGMKPEAFDADGARKLLAEAGYPDGFAITLHGPNDRYVNDDQICQAIAQMWSRIGVQTRVETLPSAIYFSRATKLEFSMMLVGWAADTAEASSPLKAQLATYDVKKGMGTANRGRYSNPKMDAVLEQALATVDDNRREKLLQQATEIAVGDLGIIPLHHQVNLWGTRKGTVYTPRTDERTLAHEFRPQ
ncbi:MAG: Oligopeptide transporter, periplasmic oligopeptide-binding protein OppA [Betaproteobacteria bacterium]|nr:Oligopeptide transporter, periplasmic oligopeptide-binding protein OppA [Betaproteobacteria bacterium]